MAPALRNTDEGSLGELMAQDDRFGEPCPRRYASELGDDLCNDHLDLARRAWGRERDADHLSRRRWRSSAAAPRSNDLGWSTGRSCRGPSCVSHLAPITESVMVTRAHGS